MRTITKLILPVALLGTALMSSCGSKTEEKAAETVHNVITVTPKNRQATMRKNFSGIVKEHATVSLGFRTPGQIERILVKEGDHVKSGQLLAILDAKDYQLQVDAAQTQYTQLKNEVERLRQLYEGNSLSGNDYEKATSGLEQLGIKLQNAKNQLSYTRLTAPVNGTIQKVNFEPAEMVSAGLPVFDIIDARSMEVQINVPAEIFALHDNFTRAYCIHKGQQYELRQTGLLPKADSNQLFTLKFALQNGVLSAGQSVDVIIEVSGDGRNDGLTIPPHAVFEDGGKSYVWVVGQDNVVKQRAITTGTVSTEGEIFVTSGLSEGERVVKAGVGMLHDGEKVKVVVPQKTNIGDLL